jgi:hypothetical protein
LRQRVPDQDLFASSLAEAEIAALTQDVAARRAELDALKSRRSVRLALYLADRLAAWRRPRPGPERRDVTSGQLTGAPKFFWPSLTHPHSPVPDTRLLSQEATRIRVWPERAPEIPGIDWAEEQQLQLLLELGQQTPMTIPEQETGDPTEYFAPNPSFDYYDSWAFGAILRHLRPARMIEVGSGWSSLLAARVNREYLDGRMNLTCIDPYPQPFIQDGIEGISSQLRRPVEEIPLSDFDELDEGDVLFIDSTHTVKTGGDVAFLFNQVVPRLRPGVVIHVHDIFLPRDYPQRWALAGWGWNEQYLVQAFLSFNSAFEILLGIAWLAQRHPEALVRAAPPPKQRRPQFGASLWFRRAARGYTS